MSLFPNRPYDPYEPLIPNRPYDPYEPLIPNRLYDPYEPFPHHVWDPFHDFHYRAPAHPYLPPPPYLAPPSNFAPQTRATIVGAKYDWTETPEAYVIKTDIPGLKKEEVKVEVEEGNVICVSGEKRVEKEEKKDKWYHVEHSSGKFLTRFRLPENAKADHMKAFMENGVLTITVPKRDAKHRAADRNIHIS